MKILDLFGVDVKTDQLLMDFWDHHKNDLDYYFTRNSCGEASLDLLHFLQSKSINTAEIIPTGYLLRGKKKKGWFVTDIPDYSQAAFTREYQNAMWATGLDFNKKSDRIKFAKGYNLEDELKYVQHSWVELGGNIIDPSGFYLDGKSGQFDRLVKNKNNLVDRYQYFR